MQAYHEYPMLKVLRSTSLTDLSVEILRARPCDTRTANLRSVSKPHVSPRKQSCYPSQHPEHPIALCFACKTCRQSSQSCSRHFFPSTRSSLPFQCLSARAVGFLLFGKKRSPPKCCDAFVVERPSRAFRTKRQVYVPKFRQPTSILLRLA